MKSRIQRLIDICFEIGLVISDPKLDLYKKTNDEKGEWIANQLRQCGFDTDPCGASWGVLKEKPNVPCLDIKLVKGKVIE